MADPEPVAPQAPSADTADEPEEQPSEPVENKPMPRSKGHENLIDKIIGFFKKLLGGEWEPHDPVFTSKASALVETDSEMVLPHIESDDGVPIEPDELSDETSEAWVI